MARRPNRLLAAARVAAGLTQEELAERANAQVEQVTGRQGAMDADYVSKLERGVHTWPNKAYRQALRAVLEANTDSELGFCSARSRAATVVPFEGAGGSDDVRRQAFLRALAAAIAGVTVNSPVAEAVGRVQERDSPSRVGMTEVQQVNHSIDVFGQWQDLYGGGVCRDAIAGQVGGATALLDASATDHVKDGLYRSVGFLIDIAGWGAFDAGYHDSARNYFELALYCAEQANDWGLRANVLSDMARQAIYVAKPDDGLSLIELAQVRQDRQTPTVRSMLSTVRGRALAKLERDEECYSAIMMAEDYFTDQRPNENPPWIAYFNSAHLAGDTGHALADPAVRDHFVEETRARLQHAVAAYDANQARSRAFALGRLSWLELLNGDAEAGIAYGHEALDADCALQSRRATDDLRALRGAVARHGKLPGAVELRYQLDRALRTV